MPSACFEFQQKRLYRW